MKIASPEIKDELTILNIESLASSASIEGALIERQEITNPDARNVDIQESKIVHITASESSLQGSTLKDIFVDSSNLTASKVSDSRLMRVIFKGCRLQGIDFNSSELSDILFEDCNLDLSNFNMATLRDVIFKNCSLNDASFVSSKQKNVAYENCIIEKIDITDTTAQDVSFASSQVFNISGIAALKGCTLDMSQINLLAPEFATMVGIKIQR